MADASYTQSSFLGGEWSKPMQGRIDRPDYRTAMNSCVNGLPIETGAWTRRPGFNFAQTTRSGNPARGVTFSFKEATPYTMEFSDNHLRFFNQLKLATANDDQTVTSISTANPAKVLTGVHGWSTADQVFFGNLGTSCPLLHRRLFTITKTSSTEFTLADAITGTAIDGSTLGTVPSGVTVSRVLDITTPYGAQSWKSLRSVQAETKAILLQGTVPPYVLEATIAPTALRFATFTLTQANLQDGPYLDPVNGSIATPSGQTGSITVTLTFTAYNSATSYNKGDYVTSSAVSYRSLVQGNLGNTPASSPTYWVVVNGGAAVGPNGFTSGDIGRHVRLFSEPAFWVAGTTYSINAVVAYNGTYWIALVGSNTGNVPGNDVTKWVPFAGVQAAAWTWAKITAVSGAGLISPSLSGVANIGDMTDDGGLAAAFDGTVAKNAALCASAISEVITPGAWVPGTIYTAGQIVSYGGSNYIASAPATSAWSTSVPLSIGSPFAYGGQYYTLTNFPDTWNNSFSYPVNFGVLFNGFFYTSLRSVPGGSGLNPSISPAFWTLGVVPGSTADVTKGIYTLGIVPGTNASYWNAHTLAGAAWVGQNFTSPGAQSISSATIFPSTDSAFADSGATQITLSLYGKASAPTSATNGTLLGTTVASNLSGSISVASSDSTTTWNYVWFAVSASAGDAGVQPSRVFLSQIQFYTPNVANGTVATLQLQGSLLYANAVRVWRLGVYSGSTGYPTCGIYNKGRLWLAGVVPNRADSSNSNDLFNFAPTGPDGIVADSNAIAVQLNSEDANTIFWMSTEQQGIICGTQGGEFLLQAPTAGPMTPTNISGDRVTKVKCANIAPVRAEHTTLFVQTYAHKIMEYFADVYSGKFSAPNLSLTAKHLSTRGLEELAYQQELAPIVWARCTDGSLIGATYKRESLLSAQGPSFVGWHQHVLGSGRSVESVSVGPSTDGLLDTLAIVSNDPVTNIRHMEFLTNIWEEGNDVSEAFFLDDAVVPTATVDTTLGGNAAFKLFGLYPLAGKVASVFVGGLDLGDYTIASDGTCTIVYGSVTGFTQAFTAAFLTGVPVAVGYVYNSDGQMVRPATPQESGARNGPAMGKKRRTEQYAALLVDSQALYIGTSFTNLNLVGFASDGGTAYTANQLFSGVKWDSLKDPYSFDSMICWRSKRMYPATVASMTGFLTTQDK